MAEERVKMTRKQKIAEGLEKAPKRKRAMAQRLKSEREEIVRVKLNKYPIAPRKMRLVADLVRGQELFSALSVLKFTAKAGAEPMAKLIKAAIASYEEKFDDKVDIGTHYIKEIMVDGAGMLKRIRPAPQGRAHLIRKRFSHTTLIIERIGNFEEEE